MGCIKCLKYSKIDYVVDSADFKQGKFTPVSLKKIISPTDFYSNCKGKTLIINLPGIYNKEVLEAVSNLETKPLNIYVVEKNRISLIENYFCANTFI